MAATPMNTTQFRDTFEPVLIDDYMLINSQLEPEWDKFVKVTTGRKLGIENQVMQYGLGVAQLKQEGQNVPYAAGGQSYKSTFIKATYALAFALTEEAMEFNELQDLLSQYSEELPRAQLEAKEIVCASVINFGFTNTANYLGGDAQPLFSTAHPVQGGTYSNMLAVGADLSEAAAEQLLIQVRLAVDEDNRPMMLKPVALEVPPGLEYTAARILRSEYRTGTANNDVSAIVALGRLKATPTIITRMTNTRAFQISTDAKDGLQLKYGWKARVKMEGDFESGNMRVKSSENYAVTWTNPRTKYASAGGP